MIKFDPTQIDISIVQLKAVSTALGGSMTIVDEKKSTATKEVLKRVDIPMGLARAFVQRHKKTTKYLKPVYTAVVRYGNLIIALERHPLGSLGALESEGVFGTVQWTPKCQENVDNVLIPLTVYSNDRDWFFDGRYIYSFESKNINDVIARGQPMSKSRQFRKINTTSIDLQQLHNSDYLRPADRTCVAFVANNGQYAISPPIWKDATDIGTTQRQKGGHIDDDGEFNLGVVETVDAGKVIHHKHSLEQFDNIDEQLAVNLNFALKAGKEVGHLFGYEAVEPLHLSRLMIELHTVNLPNIAKEVKATYDIGMKFTHTVAWLLGLQNRTNTLESYLVVRGLLKYLTSKGVFRRNIFDHERIFVGNTTINDVPQLDIQTLLNDSANRMSLAGLIEQMKRKKQKGDHHSVGTLMNEGD